MKNIRLKVIEESDLQKWEEDLKFFSASPFFAPAWLESFRNKNRKPIYLRFVSDRKTIGVAAGLRNEPSNALMKKLFRILFFYSGPAVAGANEELTKLCMAELIRYAREIQYTYVKLESWDFPCAVKTHGLSFKPTIRKEFIVDLRENWSDLIKKIKKNRRTDIRAAEREGLTFHESRSPEILDDLLRLLAETKSIRLSKKYKDYNSLYISHMNRDILHKLFKSGIVRAFYVKKKEDTLSVSLEAVYNKKAYGLFAGTNLLGYKLKANSLINFKIIEKLKNEGVEYYNFGGVPSDDSAQGLCFFKESFGAKEHVCCGGRSHHLQSPFINYLTTVYYRVPEMRLKSIIRKKFSGRN